MLLIARPGLVASSPSMRVNDTAVGSALSALCDTKTRPGVVAAQSVLVSDGVRATQPTLPPARCPAR